MNLTAKKRAGETKGANNQIRRDGNIPAVIYAAGEPGASIEINGPEFHAALRSIKKGHLSTTIFTLDVAGKKTKAIVKGIQYHRTSYDIIHLDFEELKDGVPVTLKVPIECEGAADCVGIKLGGSMRQIIRSVKVECLPKDIPSQFSLGIHELKIKQSKRLSDIALPKGIKPVATTDEVVVVIAKR
ncbi:MAG: 50S ribosomal protein L25 [Simkaniaceae bacterium]|nr:50S ribosomal protein L25 [Candidatus Sacchlamyda saccharinae]